MPHGAFRAPKRVKITARTSTITNSFVQSLIPEVPPDDAEVDEALEILAMSPDDPRCAYCGDPMTEWDHFRPLVRNKMPTGYISEIGNLVPACGKCNQSKGSRDWREWITSSAPLSPKTRSISDLSDRIDRLGVYESWRPPEPILFERVVGAELWADYWARRESLVEQMRSCQQLAEELRERILSEIIA